MMRTGLQRHVHSRPRRILTPLPAIRQSRPLRMQPPQFRMKPLADHLAISDDHSSNQRIGADPTTPPLSQLESPLQVSLIHGS